MNASRGRMSCRALIAAGLVFGAPGAANQALGDQVLMTYDPSLTTYLVGATPVQDALPRVRQRGALLDGSFRAPSAFGWALAGNPLGGAPGGGGSRWLGSIDLPLGAYSPTEIDISLPAPGFRWSIGRTYNSNQMSDFITHRDSDGYQGKNWFQISQPEIRFYDDPTSADDDMVYIVYGIDRYLEFERDGVASDEFRGVNGTAGVVQFDDAGPFEFYIYYDQKGTKTTFFGDNVTIARTKWQLWKIEDAAGNVAYIGHQTSETSASSVGFYSDGRIKEAYDTVGRRYSYTYTTFDSVDRLTEVKAEEDIATVWTLVQKVAYDYYSSSDSTSSPDELHGDYGNLKYVRITTPLTDSGVDSVRTKHYRYWEGAYNATTNPGYPNSIKYVVDYEGYRRADWDGDSTLDDDPLTMTEADLKAYAAGYFEYGENLATAYAAHGIVLTWAGGSCGCSGAPDGEFTISYGGSGTDATGYDADEWRNRAIVKNPDASYQTTHFDEVGQALSRIVTDKDPSTVVGGDYEWSTFVNRDTNGVMEEVGSIANVTSFVWSTGVLNRATGAGLVNTWTRETTGDLIGFLTESKHQEGTSGTAYFNSASAYTSASLTIGGFNVVRPFPSSARLYHGLVSSGTASSDLTSQSYTYHTSAAVLMPKQITTTFPTVSTANNGSGSATSRKRYMRKDGTGAFSESETGGFTYTELDRGQIVTSIRDAQTNHATDFATGDDPNTDFGITESGTGLHHKTTTTYDLQGRPDETTLPDGRVTKTYYTKLLDGRLVTISIPRVTTGPTTYYGPARVSVRNFGGQVEASGTIALTGGSTTSTLTTWIDEAQTGGLLNDSLDVGTLARLNTNVYNETGASLQESRQYFDIPTTGAGTEGTNFDATLSGYNDGGQRWRTKAPDGTITRTKYDSIGRAIDTWVGTNDNSFIGGEPSGTDDMVKVSSQDYDDDDSGTSGGNSNVSERIAFIQDNATDQRKATFTYDYRNRLIVQVNPTAPHSLQKYDNRGRRTATGAYSSSTGLDAGDDPTTLATNRMSLSQSFYDEKSQVYKTQRHKIDDADGSDDDNLLSKSWYDEAGKTIKTQGATIGKTFYDGLGRATHRFLIAEIDDTVYADADDVAGDIVLEESQTTFEANSSNVLMTATISRYHDDYGTGETTGALDTNADTDDLKYTVTNLEGRIQITSLWYDEQDRITNSVNYGTNGDVDFDRDGLSVPGGQPTTKLKTSYSYYDDGATKDVTDPEGRILRTEYDDAGRRSRVITAQGLSTESSTRFEYTDGLMVKRWVDLDGDDIEDTDDQVTEYDYGVIKGASAGDSKFARGDLLHIVTYPDSTGASDVVTNAYNAQGQGIYVKDQAAGVTESDYDDSGRLRASPHHDTGQWPRRGGEADLVHLRQFGEARRGHAVR